MNREIYSKYSNRKVVILFNFKKELIGYCLQKFSPKYKRVLSDRFTLNKTEARKFLAL